MDKACGLLRVRGAPGGSGLGLAWGLCGGCGAALAASTASVPEPEGGGAAASTCPLSCTHRMSNQGAECTQGEYEW